MEAPESLQGEPLDCPECGAGQRVPGAQPKSARSLWFAATLVVAVILAGAWLIVPTPETGDQQHKTQPRAVDDEPATTSERSVDSVVAASADDRSREFHVANLTSMGHGMFIDGYVDSNGVTLALDSYWGYIFGGVSHILVPDCEPYEMEWRLQSGLMFPDTKVPVSFLDVRYEGLFSHHVAVAAVKEFYRVTGGGVSIEDVQEAMQEAEALVLDVRSRRAPEHRFGWQVESRVPETVDSSEFTLTSVGDYLIKVRIFERPVEPYIRETGGCEIFIFFAFCPPGVTEVETIYASGF